MRRINRMAALAATSMFLLPTSGLAQSDGGIITDTVSHETTPDIHVWAPAGEGPYPIVYALHGTGVDHGTDWDVIGAELARNGVVTFAADYHASDYLRGEFDRVTQTAECAYRYVREIASDFGGDLDLPITYLGHSIGGSYILGGGLGVDRFGPGSTYDICFEGADRPDLIVSIAGCHFEANGMSWPLIPSDFGTGEADLVFIGAELDDTCAAWQSDKAAEVFTAAGHDATSVVVPRATHLTLIGHDIADDEFVTLADHPAPAAVAQVILGAIGEAEADL